MGELSDLVTRSLTEETATQFMDRVETQAAELRESLADGAFDNEQLTVGMEMEVYAVETETQDRRDGTRLVAIPEDVFGEHAAKELGVHNAEINTAPDVLDTDGLRSQAETLESNFRTAREHAQAHGQDLVLDAMWTLPPAEGSESYLSATENHDGVTVATNMRTDPRYVAIDNDVLAHAGGSIPLDVPGVTCEFPTILFESLATSIQPHLQVPSIEVFPAYYNLAIRTLGPLLALSANSPFLPLDLYEDVTDPAGVVERTHHELRIAVFEQSVNVSPNAKVRVPRDIDDTAETIDRVVEDDLYAPFLREWVTDAERESFADRHWEFDYKRGTYWRWLRSVVGGRPVSGACDERSVRIEYRPIPTQPTIRDVVGIQVLTAGLIHGLATSDHPLRELPWADAKRSFYSAAESGLETDLAWITANGDRTADSERIFEEVFTYAREGLDEAGVDPADVDEYLGPIETRWRAGMTPSTWKKERVREGVGDGLDLPAAIRRMQETYIERSRETDSFAEWV